MGHAACRFLLLVIAVLGGTSCAKSPDPVADIQLTIATDTPSISADQPLIVTLTLRNKGTHLVSLVKPGDGSDEGLRTPTLDWAVEKVDDPAASPRIFSRLCGNIAPIRPGDVFVLSPGEQREFTRSIWQIPFDPAKGTYNLTVIYANDPRNRVPHSVVPNEFEQHTLDQVRESTPLSVTSNTIQVVITESLASN